MGGEGESNGFRGREITAKRCRKTDQRSGDLSLRYRRLRDSAIAGADFVREDPVGLRALRGAGMEQGHGRGRAASLRGGRRRGLAAPSANIGSNASRCFAPLATLAVKGVDRERRGHPFARLRRALGASFTRKR